MNTRWLLLVSTIAAAFAAEPMPDKQKLKAELVAVEQAFSAMAQDKTILEAFEHFASPDVAFIDTDPRRFRGLEAVRQRMGNTPPGTRLVWSPLFTDVSDDGTLGYNYARYEARALGPDAQPVVRTGYFLTIWKRQPDGSWKYVMDTGAPDRPSPANATSAPTPANSTPRDPAVTPPPPQKTP